MGDLERSFQEKVKNSFSNVKLDLEKVNNRVDSLEKAVISNTNEILALKSKIDEIFEILNNKKENIVLSKGSSGKTLKPVDGRRWSTMVHDGPRWSTMVDDQHSQIKKQAENQPDDITELFKNLTDREFSVFMAIFEIEKQYGEVTYAQIANQLNTTESTAKTAVSRLLRKGIPIQKERPFNKKTLLFIKKDFHDHNLLQKLINSRQNTNNQNSLLDY